MSDFYSVPPVPSKANKPTASQWVNSGAVFHRILQKLNADDRKGMVLRCDELPLLQGTEEEIEQIFSALLQMILQRKETVSPLFLYITSKTALPDALSKRGSSCYIIQFNTNLTACTSWLHDLQAELSGIETILKKYKGSLQASEAHGCLFSFSLPGKTL